MIVAHELPYLHPYYNEKTGRVNCQICGKPFITISPRHLKKHNLSYGDYIARFPDAPVSTEEFSVRSLYGKNKDMFKNIDEPIEVVEMNETDVITLEESDENSPIVEELKIIQLRESIVKLDKVQATKKNILTYLSTIFPNVKQDIFIEEKTISGHLKYQFISDFADPIMKIAFYFPKTFWHNEDMGYYDQTRNLKLKEDGWKVVTVKKINPTFEDIDNALKETL